MKLTLSRTMKSALLSFCAAATLLVPSCFGGKTPERTYFSIDYVLGEQPHYATPKYDASVVIRNFTTANAYDRQEIIYRSNPYEFQYYWYRLWASKPRKMLRELVAKHLRYANIFSDVTLAIEDKMPDYELDVDIIAIEELDASNTEWYAHLALRMSLTEFKSSGKGVVIWSDEIDVKNAVADNQPVYVVKAMSELLDKEMTRAFAQIDKTLAARGAKRIGAQAEPETPVVSSAEASDNGKAPVSPENVDDSSSQLEAAPADVPRATLKNRR